MAVNLQDSILDKTNGVSSSFLNRYLTFCSMFLKTAETGEQLTIKQICNEQDSTIFEQLPTEQKIELSKKSFIQLFNALVKKINLYAILKKMYGKTIIEENSSPYSAIICSSCGRKTSFLGSVKDSKGNIICNLCFYHSLLGAFPELEFAALAIMPTIIVNPCKLTKYDSQAVLKKILTLYYNKDINLRIEKALQIESITDAENKRSMNFVNKIISIVNNLRMTEEIKKFTMIFTIISCLASIYRSSNDNITDSLRVPITASEIFPDYLKYQWMVQKWAMCIANTNNKTQTDKTAKTTDKTTKVETKHVSSYIWKQYDVKDLPEFYLIKFNKEKI